MFIKVVSEQQYLTSKYSTIQSDFGISFMTVRLHGRDTIENNQSSSQLTFLPANDFELSAVINANSVGSRR